MKDGILFLRGGKGFYPLLLNIAIVVRQAYNEQTGRVLLNYPSEQARGHKPATERMMLVAY